MRSSDPRRRNNEVNTEACTDVEFGAGQLNLTRRTPLQNSAWIAAASVFPRRALAATHDVSPVMEKLSAYMPEARNHPRPDNIGQEPEHHILDTIAPTSSGPDLRRRPSAR